MEDSHDIEEERPAAAQAPKPPAPTRARKKPRASRYEPLPRGYWIASFFMLLLLFIYGVVIARQGLPVVASARTGATVIELNPPQERNNLPRSGAFAVFYRGNDFEVPFRTGVLEMDFSYRTDHELGPDFPHNPTSGRFMARLMVPAAGPYDFYIDANDGARIWVNGQKIFDRWDTVSIADPAGSIELPAGEVPLYVEWHNAKDFGWLGIWWAKPGEVRRFIARTDLVPDPGVNRPE